MALAAKPEARLEDSSREPRYVNGLDDQRQLLLMSLGPRGGPKSPTEISEQPEFDPQGVSERHPTRQIEPERRSASWRLLTSDPELATALDRAVDNEKALIKRAEHRADHFAAMRIAELPAIARFSQTEARHLALPEESVRLPFGAFRLTSKFTSVPG